MKKYMGYAFWGLFTLFERLFWLGLALVLLPMGVMTAYELIGPKAYTMYVGIGTAIAYLIVYIVDNGIQEGILIFKIRVGLVEGTIVYDHPEPSFSSMDGPLASSAAARGDSNNYVVYKAGGL